MPESKGQILVVDDQRAVREELAFALHYDGFAAIEAQNGEECLAAARAPEVHAVLLDVKMPGLDGLEVLERLRKDRPDLPVIMISGHGDIDTAVLAVRRGAYDFLKKPFDNDRLLVSVKNALRAATLQQENCQLRAELDRDGDLIGKGQAMASVRALVEKVAPTDAQILITGENGTGKELVARRAHALSRRAHKPFVAINCAAIPQELVESELFGHEKGAFTGAVQARAGCFEQANAGTLFLDEIGDMPLPTQSKLLRALQERVVLRVGAQKETAVDVRVIAATNQDLAVMVEKREFREDLYYRLHVVRVHLPPLRDRVEDIDDLAAHFVQQATRKNGLGKKKLASAAFEWLRRQRWPGNVRQLKNVLEGACILADGPELSPQDLQGASPQVPGPVPGGGTDWFAFEKLEDFCNATEKEFIRRKLLENNGNIKRTAERIELQRSNLYKKLEKYGLK